MERKGGGARGRTVSAFLRGENRTFKSGYVNQKKRGKGEGYLVERKKLERIATS